MSLWRCVELCRSSLLLILKCFWMLPLIIYKHLNTLPASCPCFHKWWLAYHYSNSEALLERTLLTKATARKTTPGLSCSCESGKPHLTGTEGFTGHWAEELQKFLFWSSTHGSGWTTWLLAVGKKLGTPLLTPSTAQLVSWKLLSSVLSLFAAALTRGWRSSALLAQHKVQLFLHRERKTLTKPTSSPSPVSKIPTWSKR